MANNLASTPFAGRRAFTFSHGCKYASSSAVSVVRHDRNSGDDGWQTGILKRYPALEAIHLNNGHFVEVYR